MTQRLNVIDHTFEASQYWRDLLSRCFPLRERTIEGIGWALTFWTHPLYHTAISTPFRDRIALVWDGDVPPPMDLATVAGRIDRRQVIMKDVGELMPTGSPPTAGVISTDYVNSSVRLDAGLTSRLHHSARKNLRKAQEDYGLVVDVNPTGVFEDFYRLYKLGRQRLGVLPYPKAMFRILFSWLGGPAVLFRCFQGPETLGYLIVYLHGSEMISAHIAYDYNQRQKRITDMLFTAAFSWGQKNGYTDYRFGADNANQSALIKSKQKLGAVTRQQLDWHLVAEAVQRDAPNSLIRRTLRGMPHVLFGFTAAGTKIYFS